jgi:hypothetical protein
MCIESYKGNKDSSLTTSFVAIITLATDEYQRKLLDLYPPVPRKTLSSVVPKTNGLNFL